MAVLAAILRALRVAISRDQKAVFSPTGNPFFIVTILILQDSGAFLYALLALVLIFPLSVNPVQIIPPSRLNTWPLTKRHRRQLKLACPWINPMTWIFTSFALWVGLGKMTIDLALVLGALIILGFALSSYSTPIEGAIWKYIPTIPGMFKEIIRKDLRHTLTTLDYYVAGLLSLSVATAKLIGLPLPSYGLMILTILLLLSLINPTQSLFSLDGSAGQSRCRLLPIRGFRVLIVKDFAAILTTTLLLIPLEFVPGISALFVLLAIGHHASIHSRRFGSPWRFAPGTRFISRGLVLTSAVVATVCAVSLYSSLLLLLCLVGWGISVWWYGNLMDRS